MKRRSFVKTSFITAAAATGKSMAITNNKASMREFYELRVYSLKDERQQTLVENYFQDAAIPALNRLGSKNIGVFTELKAAGQTKIYALIPYRSWDDFIKVHERLANDDVYVKSAAPYLTAPATNPAYERIESSLLMAFARMPVMQVSELASRIFELRRYEHASEAAGAKKLEMFNSAGEISIFERLGFRPVFFGETLIGGFRPNLIYMVTFSDMTAHDEHWKAFGSDPEWEKISAIPDYSDAKLVSHITSTFLAPAACSQI